MKRIILLFILAALIFQSAPAYPEDYDPQHTILALNMAIVSIHRILATEDRIILDQEYNTIINKLALGNIESDYELTGLYSELMNFITGKGLRQEQAQRFQERYNSREQRQIIDSLSGIRAYGGNLWSWLGSLATSCVSQYFSYQTSKAELREGLDDELWQLKKEEIEDCNELQVKLLNSSWNLLRQYKLPDEYRLTQESLNAFYKAVNELDPAKRLRMLKARNIEKNFQVYPPYWFYRARAAQESNNDSEALTCFDKFDSVWRPVLRYDPYKLEAAKFRVQRLAANPASNHDEIIKQIEIIRDYTPSGDWSNNLFAGVAYFLAGNKDEGIACVETNIDFAYESAVSKNILDEMKKGELDAFTLFALQNDLKAAIEKTSTKQESEPQKQIYTKRRDLTKEEIIRVTKKYGYKEVNKKYKTDDFIVQFVLTERDVDTRIASRCSIWFTEDGCKFMVEKSISNFKKLFNDIIGEKEYVTWSVIFYTELRYRQEKKEYNDFKREYVVVEVLPPYTESDIREEFKLLPADELDRVVGALMELQAID